MIPPVSARTRTLPPRESRYPLPPVQRVYKCHRTVNPLRYSSLRTLTEVHGTSISSCRVNHCSSHWFADIGEVWANILHNVYAALVTAHGFSTTARTNPAGTEGNIVFLHLFIDALALQPCNPTCESPITSLCPRSSAQYGHNSPHGPHCVDPGRHEPLCRRQRLHALEGVCEPWARYGCCEPRRQHDRPGGLLRCLLGFLGSGSLVCNCQFERMQYFGRS
jgi:hypothetical protein